MSSLSPQYCCPLCHQILAYYASAESQSPVTTAELYCADCNTSVPVLAGFALFTETASGRFAQLALADLAASAFKGSVANDEFIYQQAQRPVFDGYAAYYPFNEALHGFFRLAERLRLPSGGRVLDLNCRTGWTGELLAALFPRQTVISIHAGPQGVLGYSGFNYWLNAAVRAPNLDILFLSDPGRLPFARG